MYIAMVIKMHGRTNRKERKIKYPGFNTFPTRIHDVVLRRSSTTGLNAPTSCLNQRLDMPTVMPMIHPNAIITRFS